MKQNSSQINCMVVDDDEISRTVINRFIEKTDKLNLCYSCESAIEAHNLLQNEDTIHLIFLDIEMPEMTGLELIKALGNRNIDIILTTSREKYAVEAFEYDVRDYLVKPINYARFLKSVSKSLGKKEEKIPEINENPFLFVRANHRIVKIDPKEIDYIEALSDYILIHTLDKKYVVHSTMKGIEDKLLPHKMFVRVHRSYIINVEHLETLHDVHVLVAGKAIPIGRSYRNNFIEKLDIL